MVGQGATLIFKDNSQRMLKITKLLLSLKVKKMAKGKPSRTEIFELCIVVVVVLCFTSTVNRHGHVGTVS